MKPLWEMADRLASQRQADAQAKALVAFTATATHPTYGAYGWVGSSRLNRRTYQALQVAAHISGWGPVTVTQGGLNAGAVAPSARTHDGLDVVDVQSRGRTTADIFRFVDGGMLCGLILFIRGTPDDPISDGMVPHLHGVMVGAQHAHPDARAQIYSTRHGYAHGGAGLGGAPGARWWGPAPRPLVEWAASGFNPANGWRP